MAVVFDRVARTFMILGALPAGSSVRIHSLPEPSEKHVMARQRMRAGAREVLQVLAAAVPKRLTFVQIGSQMPHVSVDKLQVRLSLLTSRGDVSREGFRGSFTYSLPASSTFMSTK
jgi:hypothetical protein